MSLREVARIRVIYGDTDQMGFVYYANYLRYFEVARNEYLRSAGQTYRAFEASAGLFLPVVEAEAKYHRPARYDDELTIFADIPWIKGASACFQYAIRRAEDLKVDLATGHTIHACVNKDGKIVRIPEALKSALQKSQG